MGRFRKSQAGAQGLDEAFGSDGAHSDQPVNRTSYYEMHAAPGTKLPAGPSPLAQNQAAASDSALATPPAYATPGPAEFPTPPNLPYGRNSYFATLSQGALNGGDRQSALYQQYPQQPMPPMPVNGSPQPMAYYGAPPVMGMYMPVPVALPPGHPGFPMPPGTHTDSMADNDSKFEHDGGSESPLKEAGADGQDPVPPPPANKPAKKTGLRRLMCCAPRKCVFWVFGLLLVLFLILFFSIPREPTVGVARINVIKDPVVTYNREDKDFGLDVRTNVTMRVKNNSFYPMTISSIKQKGYDSETFQYIGNGTVKSFTVGALTESYFNGTFTLSYHSSNQSSTVLNSLYSKCTPSALNDGHGGPKTGNIYLNIISEITMDSVKWLGMSPKSSSGVIIECPPE